MSKTNKRRNKFDIDPSKKQAKNYDKKTRRNNNRELTRYYEED